MTSLLLLGPFRRGPSALWWRLPVWALLTAFTVSQTNGLGSKIATGVLMGVSCALLQFVDHDDMRVARAALVLSVASGLAACLFAPHGIAEVPVVVATARAPLSLTGAALRWFTVVATAAFAAVIALALHSYSALLIATAIPFMIQRSVEHQELIRERDRAQALLAEVQRGRESEAQAAALRERGRIAREMHDVLAHSLAGLSVQLQALRAVAAREHAGPALTEPLDRAATLAKDGLAEARAAVSTLRDPVGLGLDALPALVERHPGQAALQVVGDVARVKPEAGHAVYRAVQESLTNAARYAPGSPVEVEIRWQADELTVVVQDPGPAPGRDAVAGQGTGLGLAGMGERLAEVGGRLRSGPEGTGWRVELHVPLEVGVSA